MIAKLKRVSAEEEAKIITAAKEGRITYAPQVSILDYEPECRLLLSKIFNQDYDECLVSDESQLLDFWLVTDHAIDMQNLITDTFGFSVQTHATLVQVCQAMRLAGIVK